MVLENSLDQKLSSHLLIFKNSTLIYTEKQRLELHNIELDIRGARDTDIEVMNCPREELIYCKKYDLVNKQIDTDCRQLDCKLCDSIYLLVTLIFCHICRNEPNQKLASHFLIYENRILIMKIVS